MCEAITLNRSLRTKVADVFNAPFRKLSAAILSAYSSAMLTMPTYCFKSDATISSNLSYEKLFSNIARVFIFLAYAVGAIMFIAGAFQLVMAYREGNSEEQTRAIRLLIVGIALLAFELILKLLGIIK